MNKETETASTLRELMDLGVNRFTDSKLWYGHGTDNAWDEMVSLVSFVLDLPPDASADELDRELDDSEKNEILDLVNRRIDERIPVPYITHQAWFAGVQFYVDERVMIPRSPIAELIQTHFSPWADSSKVKRILDLCTGSGAIAVACAKNFHGVTIDAADISEEALEVAKINIDHNQVSKQVNVILSDVFNNLTEQRYDIIVSNPPYVPEKSFKGLPGEYQHEPEVSFISGKQGLDVVDRILKEADKYLTEQGVLIVEVGEAQEALMDKYPKVPFTWLEFEFGGEGVFLLTAEQLKDVR